ncbi:hypothetical protein KQY30_19545 [Streptomyces sp. GMY02]|uniref:hypothetical protein n=1 Tax=Streptomyces sp. GMY02 TaxID=1333528 RepID=UPI001C2C6620|nr:hypothetical protein [Streptomyces sp. GMY02]QXE36104.1 hypothetical protein KQY30_19545 [Streptomyces sp. GMY02]
MSAPAPRLAALSLVFGQELADVTGGYFPVRNGDPLELSEPGPDTGAQRWLRVSTAALLEARWCFSSLRR